MKKKWIALGLAVSMQMSLLAGIPTAADESLFEETTETAEAVDLQSEPMTEQEVFTQDEVQEESVCEEEIPEETGLIQEDIEEEKQEQELEDQIVELLPQENVDIDLEEETQNPENESEQTEENEDAEEEIEVELFSGEEEALRLQSGEFVTQEVEPNDMFATANQIALNSSCEGKINRGESDYFKLELTQSGRLELSFYQIDKDNQSNEIDIILYGVDEYGSEYQIRKWCSKSVNNTVLPRCRFPKGIYYIVLNRTYSYPYVDIDYRLETKFIPEAGGSYEQEYNDTLETANLIQINKEIRGNLIDDEDIDCYRFSLKKDSKLALWMKQETTRNESMKAGLFIYDLYRIEGDRRVWYCSYKTESKSVTVTPKLDVPAGEYEVVISSSNMQIYTDSYWDYTLKVITENIDYKVNSDDLPNGLNDQPIWINFVCNHSFLKNESSFAFKVSQPGYLETYCDITYLDEDGNVQYLDYESRDQYKYKLTKGSYVAHSYYSYYLNMNFTPLIDIKNTLISQISNVNYTGKQNTPNVTIKDGTYWLQKGTDYTLSYSNNVNPGTATVKITGIGKYCGTVSKTFTIGLTIPSLSSVGNENGYQKLTWKKVQGAKSYKVYCKTDGKGSWILLGNATGLSFTNKKIKTGHSYTYTVRAVNGKIISGYVKKGITKKYLSVPILGKISNTNYGQTVTWKAVKGAEKYNLYYKVAGGSWKPLTTTTKLTYNNTKILSGKTFCYTVRAVSGNTLSTYNTKGISAKYYAKQKTVTLKKGITYNGYDITGDGKADRILIKTCSKNYGIDTGVAVYINGKNVYTKNGLYDYVYYLQAKIYTLANGKPFLYLYASHTNGDGPVCALFQYSSGKLKKVIDFQSFIKSYGNHRFGKIVKVSGNQITAEFYTMSWTIGPNNIQYTYLYQDGTLKRTSTIGKISFYRSMNYDGDYFTVGKTLTVYTATDVKKKAFALTKGKEVQLGRCYVSGSKMLIEVIYNGKKGWIKPLTYYPINSKTQMFSDVGYAG